MTYYVCRSWLDDIWGPIAEGMDVKVLLRADMTKPENIELLASKYMRPYFRERLKPPVLTRIKESWRYGINYYTDKDLKHAFDSMLPPFSMPQDARGFYISVWQAVFDNEPWRLSDTDAYVELGDVGLIDPWQWSEKMLGNGKRRAMMPHVSTTKKNGH